MVSRARSLGDYNFQTRNRLSTDKVKCCSDRITKLALPSMHIVASVLQEHFNTLSQAQIERLEKLRQQIEEFHQKENLKESTKTPNDFEPSEKKKIFKIIEKEESRGDFEEAERLSKLKLLTIKSASDTTLLEDEKLHFLYFVDEKKFDCQSSEDFLNSHSEINFFNIFKKDLQHETENIRNDLNNRSIKKSTVSIFPQYSDEKVSSHDSGSSRSQLLQSLKEKKYEEEARQNSFPQKMEVDLGDFARIRLHNDYKQNNYLVSTHHRHYCEQQMQIMHVLFKKITDFLTKCFNQVWNIDNYINCILHPFKSYIVPIMRYFYNLMFSCDDEDLLQLNSDIYKELKTKSRYKRMYYYSVQVENVSSILQ